ncbi:MAG: outer membrane beta-barrel protein [Gammaproteobacteria bacterium]
MSKCLWFVFLLGSSLVDAAETKSENLFLHPFYVAGVGGWGSTTWQGLVPRRENQNSAIAMSTPVAADEGGGVWGVSLGYEFTPYFALEANYMDYPAATITFDEYSLYAFDQNTLILSSNTQTASLSAKVMLIIPKTKIRFFSSAGVAEVIRQDQVNEATRVSPTFAVGFNMLLSDRVMAEIGTNYTAGYGESEINPVLDFVPFLYSVFGKLAVRFG